MLCFRCKAENAEGSRFCGHCGAPMDDQTDDGEPTPQVTDPTGQMPAAAGTVHPGLPPLDRTGKPEIVDDGGGGASLGSLRLPVSTGARAIKVALIVVLDVAMVAIGVWLFTRGGGGAAAPA